VRVILQKLIAVCGWLLYGVILLLSGGLGSTGNGQAPGVLAVGVDGHKGEAVTTIEATIAVTTIAKSVDLSIGVTLAKVDMAGSAWDRNVSGIDTGSRLAPSGIAPSKSISQPWLGLSFGLTLPEVAGGAWDRLVGGIHAGGRLAVDNREAISVDTTIAQPGLSLGFALPEVAGGAWDRLVGGIHAGGRLAVDNREAISVDTTIAQPGLGSGGSHSGEHSNEGLHFLVRYKKEKLLWKRLQFD